MRQQAVMFGIAFVILVTLYLGVDGAKLANRGQLTKQDQNAVLKSRAKRSFQRNWQNPSEGYPGFFATAKESDLRRFTPTPRDGNIDCYVELVETRRIGGQCRRVGSGQGPTVCIAEGQLFVNNPDCRDRH